MTIIKKGISFLLIGGLIAVHAPSLFAQEGRGGGRVSGTVSDEDGNPLAGVKILMESMSYDFKLEDTSSDKGQWSLYGFSKDNFRFTFSKDGYETAVNVVFLSGANRNPAQKIILLKTSKDLVQGIVEPADRELMKKAVDHYEAGQFAEALVLLQEFVDAHPTIPMARINLARTHQKLKQYPEAIAEYQKVLEALKTDVTIPDANVKTADVYVAMAGVYQDEEKYNEAATYYQKAADLVPPTDPAVPFNLAEILFKAERVDEAIGNYELAIKLNPENGLYELKLGYALLNKGDIPSATAHFEKYLALSPDDPQAESIRQLIETLKKY